MPKPRLKRKRPTELQSIVTLDHQSDQEEFQPTGPIFFIDKKKAKDADNTTPEINTMTKSKELDPNNTIDTSTHGPHFVGDGNRYTDDFVLGESDEDERRLERLVFGGDPERFLEEQNDDEVELDHTYLNKEVKNIPSDTILPFEISTMPGFKGSNESESETDLGEGFMVPKRLQPSKERKPAWDDEDDEQLSIDVQNEKRLRKLRKSEDETLISGSKFEKRLRSQFEKLVGDPEWAKLDRKEAESDDEDFMKTSRSYFGTSERLPKSIIDVNRVKDANFVKRSNASIQCVEFHPSAKVILTAGLNKTLNLFQVDGETNPKLQTVFLDNFPIYSAHFTPDGEQVILSSRRQYFYMYDMISGQIVKVPRIKGREEKSLENFSISPDGKLLAFLGNSGYINLVSAKTRQWVSSLKMNGSLKSIAFTADGTRIFSAGSDGEVYIWDLRTKRCQHKFRDEGCLKGTSLAISRNGQYVACGSNSGVVNIYDEQCLSSRNPKPLKAIMNMTTHVNVAKFNPASEILALSSRNIKDSLKLVHLPSLTVFSNWPSRKTPLGYVQCLDFSPKNGYIAIGNDKGRALLYRINHYPDA